MSTSTNGVRYNSATAARVAAAKVARDTQAQREQAERDQRTADIANIHSVADAIAYVQAHPDETLGGRTSGGIGAETGDRLSALLYQAQGFDALPTVTSRTQVSAAVAAGATEFYHGFATRVPGEAGAARARQYANNYLHGELFASQGVHGNGLYVGVGPEARAIGHEYGGGAVHQGVVLRGALAADARIISHEDAERQMKAEGARYTASHDNSPSSHAVHDLLYGDLGRYATAKGYDAVGGPKARYWLILNRGKVTAQGALERGSFNVMQREQARAIAAIRQANPKYDAIMRKIEQETASAIRAAKRKAT